MAKMGGWGRGAPQRCGGGLLVGQAWAQVQLCTGAAHFCPLRVSYPVHREGLTTPRRTSRLPRVMNPRLQGNDNVHKKSLIGGHVLGTFRTTCFPPLCSES